MNKKMFLDAASDVQHLVAEYHDTVSEKDIIIHSGEPGYLRGKLVPADPPEDAESWENIWKDVDHVVMKNITHIHHPCNVGWVPTTVSYESILGEMLEVGLANPNFMWMFNSMGIELEMQMLDWFAKMMKLPYHFMHESNVGGGIIYGSGSESTFMATLAARAKIMEKLKMQDDFCFEKCFCKLICYTSEQGHDSIDRACMLSMTRLRSLSVDDKDSLRGETLKDAIEEDKRKGLIPFMVMATLGTTNACAADNIEEIGKICQNNGIWLHVDGALMGCASICEEFQHHLKGIEYVDSFYANPWKIVPVQLDCSLMFYANKENITSIFHQDWDAVIGGKQKTQKKLPSYMPEKEATNFKDWQIHLGTRNRALKLWFVVRMFGVKGLKEHIRKRVKLAKQFERMIRDDGRFEVVNDVNLFLVCYRIKVSINEKQNDEKTKKLKLHLSKQPRIMLNYGESQNKFYLRMCVNGNMTYEHIKELFDTICKGTNSILDTRPQRTA